MYIQGANQRYALLLVSPEKEMKLKGSDFSLAPRLVIGTLSRDHCSIISLEWTDGSRLGRNFGSLSRE